ncbi:MAG: hypothetical protein ONA90_05715, partial [candidate division KSB1 bacterium]|nr:hypothetical protein [candidate division KSB1 bacterium]
MAQKLVDVIRRRTELGSAGYPGDEAVAACAAIMAKEQNWGPEKLKREIDEVQSMYHAKA